MEETPTEETPAQETPAQEPPPEETPLIDEPIIVSGGSVKIKFNKQKFPEENGLHSASTHRIVSVDVVDDNTGEKKTISAPSNGKCTITIHTTY